MLGKRYMSYGKPKIAIKHSFSAKYPPSINKDDYLLKKRLAFTESEKKDTSVEDKWRGAMSIYVEMLKKEYSLSYRDQVRYLSSKGFDISPAYLARLTLKTPILT